MNEPSDLVHFILGGKAETLSRIQPKLTKSKVCDQITCTLYEWKNNSEKVIKNVQLKFKQQKLIIRSSSVEEDGGKLHKQEFLKVYLMLILMILKPQGLR